MNICTFIVLAIRLIHKFSITGSIARQPLLMAQQAYNCWFFFFISTVRPLYSEQSRDPKNVHYTGVFTQEG